MCGIAGIIGQNASRHKDKVKKMTELLVHRGPDDANVISLQNCVLGHTRLSIVDIISGQQPMQSTDQNSTITFNGEIYGYKNLRKKIKYNYVSRSDTEVLLAAYREFGYQMLDHINGMFAFGIWDQQQETLFAARDRFGEKPFFYSITNEGELIFASEIKAILGSGLIDPVILPESISYYLKHLFVHPGHTIYKNVFVVPPAHFMTFCRGKISIRKYWSLPETEECLSKHEAVEELDFLINQAVEEQLIADVPVGAFLSAGKDSSAVVGYAAKHHQHIDTFSFAFSEGENELEGARSISQLYQTNHHEFVDSDFPIDQLIVKMQDIYDEPFADSSNIPTYLISKYASKYLKVVLTGDGADELLGGYDFWYKKLLDEPLFRSKDSWRRAYLSFVDHTVSRMSSRVKKYYSTELAQLKSWKSGNWVTDIHKNNNVYFKDPQIISLGLPPINQDWYNDSEVAANSPDDAFRMDLLSYLPGDILTKTDKASMANSLELRSPFLSRELAEFCISLPWRLKVSKTESKIILNDLLVGKLPKGHLERKKTGFGAPVNKWLQKPEMSQLVHDLSTQKNKLNIANLMNVNSGDFNLTGRNYSSWILLNLSLWGERWL